MSRTLSILFLFSSLSACAPAIVPSPTSPPTGSANPLTVTSTAFSNGGSIPALYTCTDRGLSPELKWTAGRQGTASYALIVDDPDAPVGTFTHWVAFDISPNQTEVPEAARTIGKSGKNSAGSLGYVPPCPPSGTHRYIFTVYALDTPTLGLPEGASRDQILTAIKGHILVQGQLLGRYAKP